MATQPNQHNSSPYPLNYSYNGMPELKNMADSIPTMAHDTPAANHDAMSMASDTNTATPHNDNRESGDRQRSNPMHSSDFPPYAPPPQQQQQQQGPYMNPQQQQQRPYMRPPPPYASSSWQPPPPPPHHQQQQQPDYLTNDSHAGPMRQQYGSEISDYETYVAASQHRPNGPPLRPAMRPPQQSYNQRPPMRPNLRPNMRPPGSQYNHSGYPSDSDSSSSASGGPNKDPSKFSFLNCLKQSFKDIELLPLVPVAGMLGASVYHHYKNRNRGYVVPFKEPQWVRYLGNAMMAHSAYGRLKQHGGHHPYRPNNPNNNKNSGGMPWGALLGAVAGAAMNRPGFGGGGSNYGGGYGQQQSYGRPNGGYQSYGRPNGGGYSGGHGFGSGPSGGNSGSSDMVTKVLGKIMGSLFGGGGGNTRPGMGTRDLNGETDDDMLGGFDSSSAVQKTVAEHHYRHIYRKQPNLRHASAQALGGAAAIKVLRSESQMGQQLRDSGLPLPADLTHDQMMMGLMLSEVGDLLERKAEVTPLERDDTLENIGKIALATLIKIKMDEDDYAPFPEKHAYMAYNEPHRDYADYDSAQNYFTQPRRHHTAPSSSVPTPSGQPRRHRHRRSESVSESNYAMHGKDSHKYGH
ncbi:hypothetical protein GGI17_005689 [Coemansia sp. S146]|nr:hypothetical protein GGI17_005689 [Coemansia sp. S146]